MSCKLSTSWHEKDGGDINTVLTCISDEEECGTISGTGVMLTAHGNADKPYLKLSVDDHSYDEVITAVDVLCNARHMELYNSAGDYLCTEEGVLVDTLDDQTNLFLLQKTVEQMQKKLSIKLLSLQSCEELFLLSVQVSTTKQALTSNSSPLGPTVDINKVRAMISEQPLSEGAQNLMDMVESFQQKSSVSSIQNFGMLMSMLPGMSLFAKETEKNQVADEQGSSSSLNRPLTDCLTADMADCAECGENTGTHHADCQQTGVQQHSTPHQHTSIHRPENATVDRNSHTSGQAKVTTAACSNKHTGVNKGPECGQGGMLHSEVEHQHMQKIETTINLKMQETEDRIMKALDEKLSIIEQTLTTKLDQILEKLDTSDH